MNSFGKIFFTISVFAFLIIGCNATKTQKGAVIGGTAGAVGGTIIGKAAGNKTLGTIIGAAVGGTAGAIIGHDMDKQAEQIKKQIPGAKVERVGEGIQVEFNEKILFAFSKSDLSDSAKMNLDHLAKILLDNPNTNIEIQGHTDSRGTEEYNMGLSLRRAGAVKDYLILQGVDPSRLTVKGFGETAPAYSNDTPEGMAKNRRVEFLITANDQMKSQAKNEATNQ
jgi:outer membrane protein OmpA-like peptidoglycan-associated protein